MNHNNVSKEIGKYCYSNRDVYSIIDTVLFGSVAKKAANPTDVDIMLIHDNPVFEKIQRIHDNDGCMTDVQRFELLDSLLQENNYPSIKNVLNDAHIRGALSNNLINLRYLHKNFFHDKDYFADELSRNINPNFFNHLFEYALIWNPQTENYDIPIKTKYNLLK